MTTSSTGCSATTSSPSTSPPPPSSVEKLPVEPPQLLHHHPRRPRDPARGRQRREEYAAVPHLVEPAVEDHDGAAVRARPDEPPEALPQLEHRFRQAVRPERVEPALLQPLVA